MFVNQCWPLKIPFLAVKCTICPVFDMLFLGEVIKGSVIIKVLSSADQHHVMFLKGTFLLHSPHLEVTFISYRSRREMRLGRRGCFYVDVGNISQMQMGHFTICFSHL